MCIDKLAVIGAGFCGLGISAAFKRQNILFDCLEAADAIGGNWYHGVYESTHMISSRQTTEFADYPMPEDYPDFPSAAQILSYLRNYAKYYNLLNHIQLNKNVEFVVPVDNNKWELILSNGEKRVYQGVVIANGHHWHCRYPQYVDKFSGELIHSKNYKSPKILKGKRVLVIGGGNSACDIAVESARFAHETHISMRRGYWFLPKTMFGRPTVEFLRSWMPIWFQRLFLKVVLRIIIGRYEHYGLQKPDHKIFEKHPTINSEIFHYLKHGCIKPHPDIKKFNGHMVEFIDGEKLEFDLIVCATGYHISFPFLAADIIEIKNGVPQMIEGLIHPKYRNLYLFGATQPRYGAGPLISAGAELLCTIIKTQKKMKYPIGKLLNKLGRKSPKTLISDPFQLLRRIKRGQILIPKLAYVEKFLSYNDRLNRK